MRRKSGWLFFTFPGSYKRTLTGAWSEGDRKENFRITRG